MIDDRIRTFEENRYPFEKQQSGTVCIKSGDILKLKLECISHYGRESTMTKDEMLNIMKATRGGLVIIVCQSANRVPLRNSLHG